MATTHTSRGCHYARGHQNLTRDNIHMYHVFPLPHEGSYMATTQTGITTHTVTRVLIMATTYMITRALTMAITNNILIWLVWWRKYWLDWLCINNKKKKYRTLKYQQSDVHAEKNTRTKLYIHFIVPLIKMLLIYPATIHTYENCVYKINESER